MFKILGAELERRVTLMKKFQKKGSALKYMHRAMTVVSSANGDEATLCGAIFSRHSPSLTIRDCVRQLRQDPCNSKARVEMLEFLVKRDIKDILIYREVMLHALLEVSFSHISWRTLNLVCVTQVNYLRLLIKTVHTVIHRQAGMILNDQASSQEQVKRKENLRKQKQGMEFLMECRTLLKGKRVAKDIELDMTPILAKKSANIIQFGRAFIPIFSSMSQLPLTHQSMERWFSFSKKIFDPIPLPELYELRMWRVQGKILFAASKTGDKRFLSEMFDLYIMAFNSSSLTASRIGNVIKTPIDKNFIFERALILFEMMKNFPLAGFKIEEAYKIQVNKCIESLYFLSKEEGTLELQAKLFKVLKHKKAAI